MTEAELLARLTPPLGPRIIPPPPPPKLALLHHFANVKDPRLSRTRRHELDEVLLIAFSATLGGAESWPAIQAFGQSKIAWFRQFLPLPNGIPSHDTFGRVFAALDPDAFQEAFASWINAVTEGLGLKRFQIDGKALRGTANKGKGLGCLHTVSVWADEIGLTLAQVEVAEKSNEITAIPELLRMLALEGALVSIDAMGCQKDIAELVLQQRGHYLLAVKENQPTLYHDVVACVDKALEADFAGLRHAAWVTTERSRGRTETRTYTVIYNPPGLTTRADWKGLNAIVVAARQRIVDGKVSHEMAYYITSSTAGIKELAAAIRSHWDIESCHWILDVVFKEDANRSQAGNAPQNLAWMRRMALSLLKQDKSKESLKCKRLRAGWDNDFLQQLLSLLDLPSEMEDA